MTNNNPTQTVAATKKKKIWNRVDCQRSEKKRSKTHKRLQERFLIKRNGTKRAKFLSCFVLLKSVLIISCVFCCCNGFNPVLPDAPAPLVSFQPYHDAALQKPKPSSWARWSAVDRERGKKEWNMINWRKKKRKKKKQEGIMFTHVNIDTPFEKSNPILSLDVHH